MKVVDPESGQTVATGQIGEIWVRSAGVIKVIGITRKRRPRQLRTVG